MVHYEETKYGFKYGAFSIERLFSHEGSVFLLITTPREKIQVMVTQTGFLRFIDENRGRGWKPEKKVPK